MGRLVDLWWELVRFGFRLLYNEMAFTYDLVSRVVSLGAWRCWQRTSLAHIGNPTDGLVLELAHGTGNLQIDLKERGYTTIGYDLSPNMGRIARSKLHKQGLKAALVRGQAQEIPFASGSFAAVISTFPTNFIMMDATLNEVSRVLKPDGHFIIVPNGVLTGGGVVKSFLEWLYRITGQREGQAHSAMAEIKQRFETFGFEMDILYENCPNSVATVLVARKKV